MCLYVLVCVFVCVCVFIRLWSRLPIWDNHNNNSGNEGPRYHLTNPPQPLKIRQKILKHPVQLGSVGFLL